MLKLSIMTPMNKLSVKNDPNTMKKTKYRYMKTRPSYIGCRPIYITTTDYAHLKFSDSYNKYFFDLYTKDTHIY